VRPRPGLVWYNGSKGALIVISKTMAVELAPDKIRVNCINPVAGETPLLATFMGQDTPEMRQKFIASIPLGRFSQPLDIANAALFLASDEAEFITEPPSRSTGGAASDRAAAPAPTAAGAACSAAAVPLEVPAPLPVPAADCSPGYCPSRQGCRCGACPRSS
jgi:NAD(P)-dependent dehydrogenase (short-subunit alcohol dehydrogenase family)